MATPIPACTTPSVKETRSSLLQNGETLAKVTKVFEQALGESEPLLVYLQALHLPTPASMACAVSQWLIDLPDSTQLKILKHQPVSRTDPALAPALDDYQKKFGWPFALALAGPRGDGIGAPEFARTLERRFGRSVIAERQESIRQIARHIEVELTAALNDDISMGDTIWDWHQALARHSDVLETQPNVLTVTYLTDAHLACARELSQRMLDCGCDEVSIDAVGNVVGLYHGHSPQPKRLMTGSHYDTVRNGGKYDGRLGIFLPLACISNLHRQQRRLAHSIEVVAFAEEEGQRFKATFLGSAALTGHFNDDWLAQTDADGISMIDAMRHAGLDPDKIHTLKRDPAAYLGFVEVHIEQGPVLNNTGLALGVVTSINGGVRLLCKVKATASHAGTTPMDQRSDAAVAAAEVILLTERAAKAVPESVATVGQLNVPNGSINVIPGACHFSLDVRAPNDADRDRVLDEILSGIKAVETSRAVQIEVQEIMRVAAAPSDAKLQSVWEEAVAVLGLPVMCLPSGAGHDAMKLHTIMPQAMLFVRGENGGISHNPRESTTSHDIELAYRATLYAFEKICS